MSRRFAPRHLALLALTTGLGTVVGCSDVAPTAAARPAASKSAYDVDGDGRLDDAEKAARRAARDAEKAQKKAEKDAFDIARREWKAYKDSVKHGLVRVELLRCEPVQRATTRKTIGPKGGSLKIGGHELLVPAGALAEDTEIRAEVGGSEVDVEFAPHGLVFAAPVTLTLSYEHCLFPEGGDPDLNIVYAFNRGDERGRDDKDGKDGKGTKAIAVQPSAQDKDIDAVVALTDHFSRYALALRNVYAVSYQVTRPTGGVAR